MKHNWILLAAAVGLAVAIIIALSGSLEIALAVCGGVAFSLIIWGTENIDLFFSDANDRRHNG